jgi:hypothetical protein
MDNLGYPSLQKQRAREPWQISHNDAVQHPLPGSRDAAVVATANAMIAATAAHELTGGTWPDSIMSRVVGAMGEQLTKLLLYPPENLDEGLSDDFVNEMADWVRYDVMTGDLLASKEDI